jgi:hypothetical protein
MIETFGNLVTNLGPWSTRNFQSQESVITGQKLNELAPLMGIGEELGELIEARTLDDFTDALVDITVFAADFTWRLAEVWPAFNEAYNGQDGFTLRNRYFSTYTTPEGPTPLDVKGLFNITESQYHACVATGLQKDYSNILGHLLKSHQGIRPERVAKAPDVIMVELLHIISEVESLYMSATYRKGLPTYQHRINEVWEKVSQRDWTQQRNAAKESE